MIGNYIIYYIYIYHITCAFWTLESSSGPMYKPRLPKRISSCQNIMTDPPALEAQAAIRNMAKEAADAPDQDKALREELEAEEAEKQMKKAKAKGRGKGKGKGKGKGGRGRGRMTRKIRCLRLKLQPPMMWMKLRSLRPLTLPLSWKWNLPMIL